MPKIH